jgi:nucleoid DNA-binding protein
MNKAQLIDVLAQNLGTDRRHATVALDAFLDTIVRAVQKGDSVTITGFGLFEQRRQAARVSRNPRTGETVKRRPTYVPAFRPGRQFKAVIAGEQPLPADGLAIRRGVGGADEEEVITPTVTAHVGRSPDSPEVQDALAAIDEIARPRRTIPQQSLTTAQNKVIEQHAVNLVRKYFEDQLHFTTADVGTEESYDVRAVKADQVLKIEVKGTTSDGSQIVLTYNEVELHKVEHPNNALAVVKHIILDRTGPNASGGELHLVMPWAVEQERLRPIAYRYQLGKR